ncbi:MAG TPA: hypothetical protein VJR94_00905 [Candidatus Nitrosocosmicus sp.]|nr:hypothetical protein [Candidatus Nitrosocosmicus sp.]
MTQNKTNKMLISVIVVTTVAIGSIFLVNHVVSFVTASISPDNGSSIPTNQSSVIASSINVIEKSQDVIGNSLNVSFAKAADIATSQVDDNTSIIGGYLDVVEQGNLVYKFFGANHVNKTLYQIYIDPGNAAVLYKADAISLKDFHKYTNFSGNRDNAHGIFGEHGRGGEGFFGLGHWKDKWINSHGHNNDMGILGWLNLPY